MAASKYVYNLTLDFPNGISTENLRAQILASQVITVAHSHTDISVSGPINVDIWFKDALSPAEQAELTAVVAAHDPVEVSEEPRDPVHGSLYVTHRLEPGNGIRLVTHNFCDPCSWWQGSLEQVGADTTSGDDLSFDITGHTNIIDLRHARHVFEETIDETTVSPIDGVTLMSSVVPVVYIDGVPLDQALEDADAGADRYTIDYETGTVVFAQAHAGVTVTVDCRTAYSSMFMFRPTAGNRLVFNAAEIDLSRDVDLNRAVQTVAYGSHSILTGGAVLPVQVRNYKTVHDFQAAANEFIGPLPPGFGGAGGIASEKWTFLWRYELADEFYSTPNLLDSIRLINKLTANHVGIKTSDDQPLGGSVLTITYYAFEKGELEN